MEENVNFDNEVLAYLTIRKVTPTLLDSGRTSSLRATSNTFRGTPRSGRSSTTSSPRSSFTSR